jgi:dihydroorotase
LALSRTVPDAYAQFGRVLVMPNLKTPITTAALAHTYLSQILQHLPPDSPPWAWLSLYLTDNTTPAIIREAHQTGFILAAKLYPAGATTLSDHGVTQITKIFPALETMQAIGMPLCIHAEVTSPDIDIFDREKVFINTILAEIMTHFPALKITLEHITTTEAVDFILAAPDNIAATITPHHLWLNRNDLFAGGIKPHHYCLPILKRKNHQEKLRWAATSGHARFFLGTDSAPHTRDKKESDCGCAGIYHGTTSIALYATIFDQMGELDKLENFSSVFGAQFYNLPLPTRTITLMKQNQIIPELLEFNNNTLVPFMAGQTLPFKLLDY